MSYSEKLKTLIKESGLSLSKIAEECENVSGMSITPSYISKVQTGQNIPSDEVTKALSKVLGADQEEMLYRAAIEKTPSLIKDWLGKYANFIFNNTFDSLPSEAPDSDLIKKYFLDLQVDDKILLLTKTDLEGSEELMSQDNEISKKLDLLWEAVMKKYSSDNMPDDSMEPFVPKDAFLFYHKEKTALRDGCIVLARLKDGSKLIRRYYTDNDMIILVADNKIYKPLVLEQTDLFIESVLSSIMCDASPKTT